MDTPHDPPTPPATRASGSAWTRPDWMLAGILVLGTLYLYVWGLGSYPLWDPWEPKYAQAVREMSERGDFITPWFNEKIRWTKPILIYWAMAVPMHVLGDNEFSARLPSALAAMAGVLALFYCIRKLRGRLTGFVAACVLATLPQYVYMARQAMPDMLLAASLAAAMGFFAVGRFGDGSGRKHFLGFYAALGLAVLAKGPVAGVIVLVALALFWLLDLEWALLAAPRTAWAELRSFLARYHVAAGALVFTLVAAPWYVAIVAVQGRGFFDNFILDENLKRFSEPIREHHGTASFYVTDLFHGYYPWVGFLVVGLLFLVADARARDEEVRQRWYFLSWCLAVLGIFTFAGTKIDHYVLPIAGALAVLVALVWEAYFRDSAPGWIRPALLAAAAFPLFPVRDFLFEGTRNIVGVFTNARTVEYPQLTLALKLFAGAWIAALLFAVARPRSRVAFALAATVAFAHVAYISHAVLPAHSPSQTMKFYVDRYRQLRTPDTELVFYGKIRYSMHYYLGRGAFHFFDDGQDKEAAEYLRGKPRAFVIAETSEARELLAALKRVGQERWFNVADDNPRYVMISNTPVGGQ